MRYKIEIWQWHSIVDTFESNSIEEILEWYRENWLYVYERDNCAFDIYENGKLLEFEEENRLGFHKYSWED